jgi:hypothetical protein
MAHKIWLKITYLYFFLLVIALFYGAGLVKSAYNYREADLEYSKKEIILEENALRLVFSNGYITMHYGKVQLTENSGLACFFTIKGVAYTTFKAIWKIEKIRPDELFAATEWPGLPIRQIWHLLLKDGKLSWQVDLESKEDIAINHIGIVFSFKDKYQEWSSPYEQGRMPVLEVLQQRKDIRPQVISNTLGLIASGKGAKFFPAVGLSLGEGVFLNEVLLSSCRDMFSRGVFSSVSIGGAPSFRVFKNSKVFLSSGEINLFDKKDDLLKYLIMKQGKLKN